MAKLNEWEQGVLMAASVLVATHDQPGMAADIIKELGLNDADCSDLDDFDKRNLQRVNGQRGAWPSLRGLHANADVTGLAPRKDDK